MLRLGMTNPPYILAHLPAVAEAMRHPSVYAFLHVPVQAGSDAVGPRAARVHGGGVRAGMRLPAGRRAGHHHRHGHHLRLPRGERGGLGEDHGFVPEVRLQGSAHLAVLPEAGDACRAHEARGHQGGEAAPRELTKYVESYSPHAHLLHTTQRVWVTDVAKDGVSLVGHTKAYEQVLLRPERNSESVTNGESFGQNASASRRADLMRHPLMGRSASVRITEVARWHAVGDILEVGQARHEAARAEIRGGGDVERRRRDVKN